MIMSILAMALQMEIDGEKYYFKQAGNNKGNTMQRAFLLLAGAESKHAELLRRMMTLEDNADIENLLPATSINLFTEKADFIREADVLPGQLEVYIVALDMEQKSIDLYQKMLAEATDDQTSRLMDYLIKQEQEHYAFFDELTTLLKRPRDWVEAAEFGKREEY
jgi:rubrerythrin